MRRRNVWTLCLTMLLLTLSTTPAMCDELSTTELWKLLDEAEVVIVELMDENADLLIEAEAFWKSCGTLVEATATEAVSVAVKPLLAENAGLVAECAVLRRSVVLWASVGTLGGLVVGFLIAIVMGG